MENNIWYNINFLNYYQLDKEELIKALKSKRKNTNIEYPKNWLITSSIKAKQLLYKSTSTVEREQMARDKANYETILGLLNLDESLISSVNFACASSALQQLRSITRNRQLTEQIATLSKIAAELKLPSDKLNAAKSLTISTYELTEYSKTESNQKEILLQILAQKERAVKFYKEAGKLESAINEFIFAGDIALQLIEYGNPAQMQEKALNYYNRALDYKNQNPHKRLFRSPKGLKLSIKEAYRMRE